MTTRRYGLKDEQWEQIKDLLPGSEGYIGTTAKDNRLFVEAVLYRYRTGIPWRDLPVRFGDFRVIHTRFSRWAKSGVWEMVFQKLAAKGNNEFAMLDSSIVRAHQHSAGAKKTAQMKEENQLEEAREG
jgi:transposase